MDETDLVLNFNSFNKPVPTNQMYKARKAIDHKSGHTYAVTYKSNQLQRYQKLMSEELKSSLPENKIARFKYLFSTGVYDIVTEATHYIYYKDFYKEDTSNLIKALEDCIVNHLGIDDSRTTVYRCEKVPVEVRDMEHVHIEMKLVPKNPLTQGR